MEREQQQLRDEGTYAESYIPHSQLPADANVVGSMWVLQIKRDKKTGAIDEYKARLVALGNNQSNSSYKDIKSGTARNASVKLLIAIAAKTGAHSMVLDVKGAFLKAPIDESLNEQLYLRLPDGHIYKLRKYL